MKLICKGGLFIELRWNLDNLYPSFTSDKFKDDYASLEEQIAGFNSWVQANLTDQEEARPKLISLLEKLVSLRETSRLLGSYAHLRLSTDVKNEEALGWVEKLERKSTEITKSIVRLQQWLGEIPDLAELLSEDEQLEQFTFVLQEWVKDSKYLLGDEEEELIARMKQTGSRSWAKLQQNLTSTLLVDIEVAGERKQLPLSVVRNMAYDEDSGVRKKAYEAELASYRKIEAPVAAALNGIKGEVLTITERKGY
ncbi:MAG: oligoendopeptidase F, partial [Halanaerobium sp.]|nr:oligoendopeptidase F [Halanaerobium sp.]